ncbi:MAG: hypothetical protein ACI846_003059, partial [Pseudoalteromonas distincta]
DLDLGLTFTILLVGYVGILTHIVIMRQVKAIKLLRKHFYLAVYLAV